MQRSSHFAFDGTAGTYFEPWLIGWLLTIFTAGIAYPWAFCRTQRWKAEHSYVDGRRLTFTGTGGDLFGYSLKWTILIIFTVGIYTFWAIPEFNKWLTEHTDFEAAPFIANPITEQPHISQQPMDEPAEDSSRHSRDMNPIA